MKSAHLGAWIALLAALQAGAATLPSSCPVWVSDWVAWSAAALSAGTAAYVAWSRAVTLPGDSATG